MITREEIENMALLSKLYVTPEEMPELVRGMQAMVDFAQAVCDADSLDEGDNDQYIEAHQLRADEVRPSLSREEILGNAPEVSEDWFLLHKKVLPWE